MSCGLRFAALSPAFPSMEINLPSLRRPPGLGPLLLCLLSCLASVSPASATSSELKLDDTSVRLVAEMAPLPDHVSFKREERLELEKSADVAPALAAAEAHVRSLWPRLSRELDLVALSRWHIEPTRGFVLPAEPDFEARILGRDESGALHVDLRGPRLPARFDIVHRHLHLLAVVTADGQVERMSATIRLRVYE